MEGGQQTGPSFLGVFWLILGIAVVAGGVVAVILIPQNISDEVQIPCDSMVSPLNVSGTYTGSYSCDGVNDSGVFTETGNDSVFYVEQSTFNTVRIYDNSTGITYMGVIPMSANMAGRPEIGFWSSMPSETGRWEVLQTCFASNGTIARVVLSGTSIQAGTDPDTSEAYTETCFDRIERTDETVPGGIFPPTAAPTLSPTSAPTSAPTAAPTTAAPTPVP